MLDAALLACALQVHPVTIDKIVQVKFAGNPIALHVNNLRGAQPHPMSAADAATIARTYVAAGYNVDLGLGQLNSRNLPALGYTIEDALEPCLNISAGARILRAFYLKAAEQMGEGQAALKAALSAYNTGSFRRGFLNGYVAKYYSQAPAQAQLSVSSAVTPPTHPISATTAPSRPRPVNPLWADTRVSWSETPRQWIP